MSRFVPLTTALLAVAALGYGIATIPRETVPSQPDRAPHLQQLTSDDRVPVQIQADYAARNQAITSQLWMAGGGGTLLALLYALLVQAPAARNRTDAERLTATAKPAGDRDL